MNTRLRSVAPIWATIAITLTLGFLVVAPMVHAAGPAAIGLGTAAPFAVLAGTPDITSTGATTITGDVGISPGAAVTGFPPGTVSGATHMADAVAVQAKVDLGTAYDQAAGLAVTANHGTLGGLTLVGGVYNAGGVTLDLTGTLILDGENDPNSVWVFQATSDLITAASSSVSLINQASACNVFWQVTSSATLGAGSTMVGTIMALTSITMADSVTLTGRALARNGTVTLINDSIDASTCAAAVATASPTVSPTASPTASPTPGAPASVAPTTTPSSVPDTAQPTAPTAVSWPLFLIILAIPLLLAVVVVKMSGAAEARE